jgi:hypothetical protein
MYVLGWQRAVTLVSGLKVISRYLEPSFMSPTFNKLSLSTEMSLGLRTEWKYNMNITAMATVHPLQLVPPPPGVDLLPSCYKDQIAVSCQSCNAPRVKLGHGQQPQLAGHLGVESTSSYCQSLKKKDTVSIFEVKHSININKMD